MEISDDLLCLFNEQVQRRDGEYVIEVPAQEIQFGDVEAGEVYRAALLPSKNEESEAEQGDVNQGSRNRTHGEEPPVQEGERREVVIESLGDQGDGIAKVERGFVIIVEGADVGEEVVVEIINVAGSYAVGEVVGEAN